MKGGDVGLGWNHSINNWSRDGRFLNHSKQFKIRMLGAVFTGMAFLFWIYPAGSHFFMMLVAQKRRMRQGIEKPNFTTPT